MNAGPFQRVRRILIHELDQVKDIQSQDKELESSYPRHNSWLENALSQVKIGKRVAFGYFEKISITEKVDGIFFNTYQDRLCGSLIISRDKNVPRRLIIKSLAIAEEGDKLKKEYVKNALLKKVEEFGKNRGFLEIALEVASSRRSLIGTLVSNEYELLSSTPERFSAQNATYFFSKKLPKSYMGDPFDLLEMVIWLLKHYWKFFEVGEPVSDEREEYTNGDELHGFHFDRTHFSLSKREDNLLGLTGECLVNSDFYSIEQDTEFPFESTQLFSSNSDLKLLFSFFENADLRRISVKQGFRYFTHDQLISMLEPKGLVSKMSFSPKEIGGLMVYMDKRFLPELRLFRNDKLDFIFYELHGLGRYLLDEYEGSINPKIIVFFEPLIELEEDTEKRFVQDVIWGYAEIISGVADLDYEKGYDFFAHEKKLFSKGEYLYYSRYKEGKVMALKLGPPRLFFYDPIRSADVLSPLMHELLGNKVIDDQTSSKMFDFTNTYLDDTTVQNILDAFNNRQEDEVEEEKSIERNIESRYDVFISYNSSDRKIVQKFAKKLRDEYKLKIWIDIWELVPGEDWLSTLDRVIDQIPATIVCFGESGFGPWQNEEQKGVIISSKKKGKLIIPVLFRGAPEKPSLPFYLESRKWVDLRKGMKRDKVGKIVDAIRAF